MKKITLLFFMSLLSLGAFAQGLPLESFDETGVFPPTGWEVHDNGIGPAAFWVQATGSGPQPAHTGAHAAYLNKENVASGIPEDWLVTPSFTVPTNPQLRFWSRLTIGGDDGSIYRIMITTNVTDAFDAANYTNIQEWTELEINPSQTTYTEKILTIPAIYVGQDVHIAFVMAADNGDRWLVDDVTVVEQCLDPTDLGVGLVGIDNAELTWTNTSGATNWEIEVLPAAAIPDSEGVEYSGALPYVATTLADETTPLTENTDYKYYVRALCDDGGTSEWVGPFLFSTVALGETCGAPIEITTLPYSTTDNTSNYGDDYNASPGATGCGTTGNFLNGDDVVYSYTAAADGLISIEMSNNGADSGLFVYDDCANIGVSCLAGGISGFTPTPISIDNFAVTNGQTYYFVISSDGFPQSTAYMLTVQQVFCAEPVGLPTTGADNDSANLSWTNPSGATSWEVVVQEAGTGVPTGSGDTVNTTPAYVAGGTVPLLEATNYEYYVRADCGDGTFSAWAGPYTFSTTQVAAAMDYSQDFEGVHGWSLSNGTAANQWNVGTAIANGGTQSLYVSNDNGATTNYTNNSTSVVHAYRDIQMPAVVDQATLSFDYNIDGENCCDYVRVWVVPASFTPTAGTQINAGAAGAGAFQIGGNFNDSSGWETELNVLDLSAYSGEVMRLIFEWRNDGSVGTAPAAIDNIEVALITCPSPTDLAIDDLQEDEVTFVWTGPTSVAPTFDYYFATASTAPDDLTVPTGNTASESVTINPLTPSTAYWFWVRSNCGPGDTSFWVGPLQFTTPQIPATMDFEEDFEGTISWTLNNGTATNQWVIGEAISNSPTHSLYVSNDGGTTNNYTNNSTSVVQAYRDIAVPASAVEADLSFDFNIDGENCCDYVRVWMVPVTFTPTAGTQINAGAAGAGAFQVGGNYNDTAGWETENAVVSLTDYAGSTVRLIFEWRNDGSVGQAPAAIDNVSLSLITCPQPIDLVINDVEQTTAEFAWTNQGTATEWEIYYVPAGDPAPTDATVGTPAPVNPHPLTGLDESTGYDIYVRAICAADDASNWSGPLNFQTQCGSFNVPFYEGFNSDSTTELCWTVLNENGDGDAWNMNYAFNPFEGNQSAAITTDFNNGNNDDWLISPTINLTGNQRLRFHQRVQSTFEPNDFEVLLSTTGIDAADFTVELIALASYDNTEYIEYEVYLEDATNTLISGPVNIAWHVPGGGLDGWRLYIDNVIIDDIPSCPQPVDIAVSEISNTTADISWTEMGSATAWEIIVVPTGDPAPADDAVGIPADSNPFTLPEGTIGAGLIYDVYVRANCGPDDLSLWSGPETFTSAICPLEDQCGYEFVMTDTGGNTWNGNTMSVIQNGITVATLTGPTNADGTNPVTTTVMLCPGVPLEVHWNDDGFSDDQVGISIVNPFDETIFNKPPGEGSAPSTIYEGIPNCEPITCPQPTDLLSEGYNFDSILLSWTPGGTETEWELVIQNMGGAYPGENPTSIVNVENDPEYLMSGLNPDLFYEYYVRAVCGEGDESFWSGPFIFNIFSPPGCAAVDVFDDELEIIAPNSEISLCPGDDACFDFSANYFQLKETDTYDVESIAYSPPYPFLGGTELNVTTDDIWSPVVDLPFDFCFFGETYNEAKVGSNGVVLFGENMTDAGNCPWSYTQSVPDPAFPIRNAIYGVYQDINPAVAGSNVSINYQVLGNYPCRALVVNYYDVPQFSCGLSVGTQTSQIVIYEVSNIIEVYVESRTPCTGTTTWNEGRGVIGIQNATGTEGFTPPGRNTGAWTATEEAWRFTPSGDNLSVVFEWLVNGGFETNDTDLTVCPTEETVITARATYTACTGEEIVKENNFTIHVGEPIEANEPQDLIACATGADVTFDLTESLEDIMDDPTGFNFTFYSTLEAAELGLDDNLPEMLTTDTDQTIYIRITEGEADCFITRSFDVTVVPTPAVDVLTDVTACDSYTLEPLTTGNYYTGPDGTGTMLSAGEVITSTQMIYIYAVSAENADCSDESSFTVTINDTPVVTTPGDQTVCGEYILPALAVGNYYTEAGGAGTMLNADDVISADQTIYVYAETATTPNCSDEDSFTVTIIDSPVAQVLAPVTACDSYVLEALDADNNYYTGSGGTGTMLAAGDTVTASQTLYIFAQTNPVTECTDESEFVVTIIESPEFSLGGPYNVCVASNAVITVAPNNFNAGEATYSWTFNDAPIAETGSSVQATDFGTYEVTVTVGICSNTQSVNVTEDTDAIAVMFEEGCEGADYMITVMDIDGSFNPDTASFAWTGPDGFSETTQTVTVPGAGLYTVTVVTAEGCIGGTDVNVLDTSCSIPRGISPNNDGMNDNFDLTSLDVRKISIFNRYGKEVFSYGNYTDQWHGQSDNGNELPTGTYFYSLERSNGESKTGWVYINREE